MPKKNIREVGKEYVFCYSECLTEPNGWVDPSKFLPLAYDLVNLKIKRNGKEISGWWTGNNWESIRKKKNDIVVGWKRKPEEEE